jgi:endoglucanase
MGIEASAPPSDAQDAPAYGFDAARLPLRYAESCDERDRKIAAGVWQVLSQRGTGALSSRHDLEGDPVAEEVHAVSYVGAAAAAQGAGEREIALALLRSAEEHDNRFPTYYGSALLALGRLMLTTERLGSCRPVDTTAESHRGNAGKIA